jgi:RNA recognition motif-containing protein
LKQVLQQHFFYRLPLYRQLKNVFKLENRVFSSTTEKLSFDSILATEQSISQKKMSDQGFEEGSNKNGESEKRDRSESRDRDNEERRSEGGGDDRHHEESNRDDRDDRDRGEEGRDRKHEGPTTSLLVRNLNFNLRADELKKLFGEFGDIRDVYIPMVKRFLLIVLRYLTFITLTTVFLPSGLLQQETKRIRLHRVLQQRRRHESTRSHGSHRIRWTTTGHRSGQGP